MKKSVLNDFIKNLSKPTQQTLVMWRSSSFCTKCKKTLRSFNKVIDLHWPFWLKEYLLNTTCTKTAFCHLCKNIFQPTACRN